MSFRAAALVCALLVIIPAAATGQESGERRPTPISKRDLTRMLVSGTYQRDEIAGMVRRACLSFVPTATERELFRGLGAERSVLSAIDGCFSPPTPLRAQTSEQSAQTFEQPAKLSELPAQPSEQPPATFASPVLSASSEVRPEDGPPEAQARDESSRPDSPSQQPSPQGPPAGEPAVEERVSRPTPLPEPEAEVETPAPTPIPEALPDTVSAAVEAEPRAAMPATEVDPAGPSDEVGRLRRLAAAAAARGDPETALGMLRDIISLSPDDPLAWFELGAALASAGDGDGARAAFIRAAALDRARRHARP